MRKLLTSLFVLLAIIINTSSLKSQPMMGGDITWTCVGQDSFIVSLTLYRDCNSVQFSGVSVPIRCATTGASITALSISRPQGIDITPTCATSCSRCQTSGCAFPYGVEKYVYTKLAVLSSAGSCCKIVMSYSRCCRQSQITTGPANSLFYIDAELDRCLSPCDNSPVFTNSPINIICIGQNFVYNHGVVDTDRDSNGGLSDSIAYEWTQPLSGVSSTIGYTGQYAYDKPVYFWGFPNTNLPFPRGFHLDPATGDISFKPMKIEQTVMVLKVSEWRTINGKRTKIGVVRRDIQVIVLSCPNNNAPVLGGPYYKEICAGETVNFSIATNDYDTKDTLRISWNHAVANASWSDNNDSVKHPTGTLSWTPTEADAGTIPYVFTVTVKDDACPVSGSSTRAYQILVKPKPKANIMVVDSGCGNYYFNAQAISGKSPSFTWTGNFNPVITNYSASFQHKFNDSGTYPYKLDITAQQCQNTYFDTIVIADSFIKSGSAHYLDVCYGDSATLTAYYVNNSGSVSFNWSTGDSTKSINYAVNKDTLITVEILDSMSCRAIDSFYINMLKLPVVDLGSDRYLCSNSTETIPAFYSFDSTVLKNINWYDQSDSLISSGLSSQITVGDSGIWRCIVEDSLYCVGSDTIQVFVNPEIKAFAVEAEICNGDTATLTANTTGSQTINDVYRWYNKNTSILVGVKQTIQLMPDSTQEYLLVVRETINGTTCSDSFDLQVQVIPLPEIQWGIITEHCVDGSILSLNSYVTTDPVFTTKSWISPSSGLLQTFPGDKFSPVIAGAGTHKVVVRVEDSVNGCISKDSNFVIINALPQPFAGDDLNLCYGVDELIDLKGMPALPAGTWRSVSGVGVQGSVGNYQFNAKDTNLALAKYYHCIYHYVGNNGCENEDTMAISVNKISADFESDYTYGTSPLTINFSDLTDPQLIKLLQWKWDFGTGIYSTKSDPLHIFLDTGTYDISLYVSDGNQCMDSITKTALIRVTPTIGIQEKAHAEILVYPNPASNDFTIKLVIKNDKLNQVEILSTYGRIIKQYHNLNQLQLHVKDLNLSSGFYFIKVISSKGSTFYYKILIE